MDTSAVEEPVGIDRPVVCSERRAGLVDVRSLGILGGTFNPPHLGHVEVARHARDELGLQQVLLMPALIAPHKPAKEDPGVEHRLRMCRLSVRQDAGISVCSLELERAGPSYTVDTLQAIRSSHPDARLTFIVGADTASTLPEWREPARLLELADLAVAAREGSEERGVLDTVETLIAAGEPVASGRSSTRVRFLDMPVIQASSSTVRERVERGQPIEELVGRAVASYIAENGLYGGSPKAGG
jgi:nicotinate-nucleotide adenylyltransferase